VRQIQSLGRHADVVLIDVGSASAEAVQRFWHSADEGVLVTTPDSVSVMDCYATLKAALAEGAAPETLRLIINKVQDPAQAADVHRRIDQSARRFLQREIGSLGSVTLDPQVARSTSLAVPVMLGAPECPAAQSIEAIAATLASTRINSVRTAA
jgi:flagellar biosynthesis protein FlhG